MKERGRREGGEGHLQHQGKLKDVDLVCERIAIPMAAAHTAVVTPTDTADDGVGAIPG